MKKEYVIWGVPKDKTEEEILFTEAQTKVEADKVIEVLQEKYGCTNCRIQVIDFTKDFNQEFINAILK